MKKLLMSMFLVLSLIGLTACGGTPTIEEALAELNETQNFTMSITMETGIMGDIKMTITVDEDTAYMEFLGQKAYVITKDDQVYTVTKSGLNWEITDISTEMELETPIDVELLDPEMFEKDGNKYVLKQDKFYELFGEEASILESFEMTIKSGSIEIIMIMSEGFMEITTTMIIDQIGKTKIEVPEAVMDLVNQQS